ncbi:MAG: type II toxin-antitoxin system PemK/MazF family toxin [Deltaproteobacteria bacterium]|nr:type II toxin-antitoxin system PemK/MazF family toxin [Deltaproteobacteria bacterium]
MKRGTLCWVDLEPAARGEFGKTRPALVVSNSEQNVVLPSVVVVPLSSRAPEIWPLRLEVKVPGGKLSYAVIPGIRQISKTRIQRVIGEAAPAALDRIAEALALYLG